MKLIDLNDRKVVELEETLAACAKELARMGQTEEGLNGVIRLALDEVSQEPMEMRLCEQDHIILRANQPYIFRVDPTCPHCVELDNLFRRRR